MKEEYKDLIGKEVECSDVEDFKGGRVRVRRLVGFLPNGSFLAMDVDREDFDVDCEKIPVYKHIRPILEPKKRDITMEELIEAGALFVRFDGIRWTINSISLGDIKINGRIMPMSELINYGYQWSSSTAPNEWRSFEVACDE